MSFVCRAYKVVIINLIRAPGFLVKLYKSIDKGLRGFASLLCSLSDYVKEIFEVSGFTAIIPIAETVDAGIEVLS